jgi:hypothetical protein
MPTERQMANRIVTNGEPPVAKKDEPSVSAQKAFGDILRGVFVCGPLLYLMNRVNGTFAVALLVAYSIYLFVQLLLWIYAVGKSAG